MMNTLKVLYIFIFGIGVFLFDNLFILLGISAFHLIIYFSMKVEQKSLKFLFKVRWFILIIFSFHSITGPDQYQILKIKNWVLTASDYGIMSGSVMALKLISMLLITNVVRMSMKRSDFVQGLRGVGMSSSSSETVDEIFEIVSQERKFKKRDKKMNKKSSGNKQEDKASDVLFRGKVGNIPQKLLKRLNFASDKFKDNPNSVIASSSLAITLIRMVKIAPGIPIAPGHKNILMFPIFIYGIDRSKKKFSGLQMGFISGILHFSMGFGKYGPLGIIQFSLVGLVLDFLLMIPVKRTNLFFLLFSGAVTGLFRVSSEILLAYILGLPKAFFILYLPYIIAQVSFGMASGFITRAIIKND